MFAGSSRRFRFGESGSAHGEFGIVREPDARGGGRGGFRMRGGRGRANRQRLQLVRLYRPRGDRRLHRRDRHRGQLRRLQFERHRRDQAPRRRLRLRRGRAQRHLRLPDDRGRRPTPARQGQAAEPPPHVAGDHRGACRLRSGQPLRGQLHVGHDGARLQHRQGAGAPPRRDARTRGRSSSTRAMPRGSPNAASMCSTRRTT